MDPVVAAAQTAVASAAALVDLMLGRPAAPAGDFPSLGDRIRIAGWDRYFSSGRTYEDGPVDAAFGLSVVAEGWCPTCGRVVSVARSGRKMWSATLHLTHPHPVVVHTRGPDSIRQVAAVVSSASEYQQVEVATTPPLSWEPPSMSGPRPIPERMLPSPLRFRVMDGPAAGRRGSLPGGAPDLFARRPADSNLDRYPAPIKVTYQPSVRYRWRVEGGGVLTDERDGAVLYWWDGQ